MSLLTRKEREARVADAKRRLDEARRLVDQALIKAADAAMIYEREASALARMDGCDLTADVDLLTAKPATTTIN